MRVDSGLLGITNQPQHGWTHIGDRNYDPATGRFLQPDRLIDPKDPNTWNPYAYSNHNPTNHTDPTGLNFGGGFTGFTPGNANYTGPAYNAKGEVVWRPADPRAAAARAFQEQYGVPQPGWGARKTDDFVRAWHAENGDENSGAWLPKAEEWELVYRNPEHGFYYAAFGRGAKGFGKVRYPGRGGSPT